MLTRQSHKHAALIALSAFAALVACIFAFAPHAMADSSGAAEGGSDATLEITSVSELAGKKAGIDLDEIRNDADKISAKMMRQILSDQTLSSDGVLTSTIA